ncbi:MAG TPA: RNA polymerase sigma factor [Candidatus Baltobacteraceae bacterium]|nr:RNA polymerase sigma factor [Candidatus Baltobacteraceae bacterium]
MAFEGTGFEHAYRAHAARLRSVAYHVLHDRDAAEDAVHGALLRVWSAGTYRAERGPLLPFLIACVRREALDAVRGTARRRVRETSAAAAAEPFVDPTAALDPVEAQRVRRALGVLSPEQRNVIERAYYGERTLAEIAQELAIPIGTVKSRLAAALRRLHGALSEGSAS